MENSRKSMIFYLTSYMDVAEMMRSGDGKNPSSTSTGAKNRDKPVVGDKGKGKPYNCGKPYKNCKPPGSSK